MLGVVLLPAAGMTDWVWEKVHNRLSVPTLMISPRIRQNTKEKRLSETFDELILYHRELIEAENWDRIIIVGHSGAGLIAGTLAKMVKNVVSVLFVAANIPGNGRRAIDVFPEEIQRKTIAALSQQAEFDRIPLKSMEAFVVNSLANNCSESDREHILNQDFLPEPLCVINAKMNWDDFPAINRGYIVCRQDRTLTEKQQEHLAGNLGITRLIYLDTDHLPMISAQDEFIGILEKEIAAGNIASVS